MFFCFLFTSQPDIPHVQDYAKGQQFAHQASAQPPRRKYFPGHRTGPTQYGAVSSRHALAAPHAAELCLQPFDANVPAAY
jgi:hypothetical protein